MSAFFDRRSFLAATAVLLLSSGCTSWGTKRNEKPSAQTRFKAIERDLDGRLGVFALNTDDDRTLGYRADERFPFCSTFKALCSAAILAQSVQQPGLLNERIYYKKKDLITYSPITEKYVGKGMTVAALCEASTAYSDNTAANLLLTILGGPTGLTAFARSIGDTDFRLDRWEPELNTAIPGDMRDTTTPTAMGLSLGQLVLEDTLKPEHRKHLIDWLRASTTGSGRIKAGIPDDWVIGDKTSSGQYGTANDIAVLWPPASQPVVVVIYTTRNQKNAAWRNDIIAAATRIVVEWVDGALVSDDSVMPQDLTEPG